MLLVAEFPLKLPNSLIYWGLRACGIDDALSSSSSGTSEVDPSPGGPFVWRVVAE